MSRTKWNKKKHRKYKYDSKKLFRETCSYDVWSRNEESSDTASKIDKEESSEENATDLPPMPPLGDDKEVKEGKMIKNFDYK